MQIEEDGRSKGPRSEGLGMAGHLGPQQVSSNSVYAGGDPSWAASSSRSLDTHPLKRVGDRWPNNCTLALCCKVRDLILHVLPAALPACTEVTSSLQVEDSRMGSPRWRGWAWLATEGNR